VNQLSIESTIDMEAANTVTHGEAKQQAELAKKLYESAQDGFAEAEADQSMAEQDKNKKADSAAVSGPLSVLQEHSPSVLTGCTYRFVFLGIFRR
jgi:hypothetical protein